MFNLLSPVELEALSDIELRDMILKLSQAIRETKSMQDKESAGQKLYHLLEAERERRKISVDGMKTASV
jgi:hypothetical protein